MPGVLEARRNVLRLWLADIIEDAQEEPEHRIRTRFIMHLPGIYDLALKNTHRDRCHGKSEESQKLTRSNDYEESEHKQHNLNDEQKSHAS